MADPEDIEIADHDSFGDLPLRNEDGRLNGDWIDALYAALADAAVDETIHLASPLHASDTGDVLEALTPDARRQFVSLLGSAFDYNALTEVDDSVRAELTDFLPNDEIARAVSELDSDDAVLILEDMDEPDREAILAQMPAFDRLALKRSLDYPEDSAGRRMQTEFIAIPPFWTVGQTIDYLRKEDTLPAEFYQLYVVDPGYNLLGTISLDIFLRAQRAARIEELMNTQINEVEAHEDQEEAARIFERYDLVEVAVVDDTSRLVGILTIDDMVDVIHEEADEDIRALAGIGDEEISDNVWETVRSRVTWLIVNLFTAILASIVIGVYDMTIESLVALAVLMPIVASMGGNAGTQTMTITVRALSTRNIDQYNIRRLILRELLVGVANGVIFAVIMGVVAAIWFQSIGLGIVIGIAIIINMISAGLAGILIPLGVHKLGIDPAVASSAFVTTITDVVGFFAFLSLARLWFSLP